MEFARQRVALIASSFYPHVGGVEEHTRQVAGRLADRGHAVEVWTVDRGDRLETVHLDGFPVRHLPAVLPAGTLPALARFTAQGALAWRSWGRAYRQFGPTVLHVQCFGPNGLYAVALARRFRARLILSSHGETFADDHGAFDQSMLLRRGLRAALSRAAAVTGPSQVVLDDLSHRFGATGGVVVQNGVDQTISPSAGTERVPGRVAAVGRLGRMKGFDLLIDAFAAGPARSGATLVIAGDGDQRGALLEQADSLGVSGQTQLVGRLDGQAVADLMASAAVVAVPSRQEAFGIVVLESWRAGTPVVATTRGGPKQLIRDGVDGLLADPLETSTFAAALSRLLADPALAQRLGTAGKHRVSEFTWERVAEAYEQLYDPAAGAG